jgi:hypothetical protein
MPNPNTLPPSSTNPQLTDPRRTELDSAHTLMYDIETGEPQKAGDIVLRLAPQIGRVTVDSVFLYNKYQGKGVGTEVYKQLPNLVLPEGQTLTEAGYKVQSSDEQTIAGKALWASLAKKGAAKRREDGIYELITPEEDK